MSEETDINDERRIPGNRADGIADNIRALNDQLMQLGQIAQDFANQGLAAEAEQATQAAAARRAELQQLEAHHATLEKGAGYRETAHANPAHMESRLSGLSKEVAEIERSNLARKGAMELEQELAAHAGRVPAVAGRFAMAEEASAISRARMLRFAQVGRGMGMMGMAEDMAGAAMFAEAGGGMLGAGGMLGMMGGPLGMGAMAAVMAGGAAIDYVQGIAEDRRHNETRDKVARARDKSRLDRLAGPDGTASEARDEAATARADYEERAARDAELRENATPHWSKGSEFALWAMNKVFGWQLQTREGEQAIEENNLAKERDQQSELRAKHIAKKKFKEEEAPLIEAQEKRNAGDEKGAKVLEDQVIRMRTYNELKKRGAEESQAQEGAAANLEARHKAEEQAQKAENEARAQSFAHVIDARTGAAASARLATMAAHATESKTHEGLIAEAVKALHGTVRDQYTQASAQAWRAKFTRRMHN
jgi:hypothetical protein